MKLDNNGYQLICKFEGLRLKPYLCSAGVATIGYGSTFYEDGTKVTMKDIAITKERAFNLFKTIADKFATKVNALLMKTIVTQQQFNALCSLAYNIGTHAFSDSTLLKKIKVNPNDPTILKEFLKWNKAGGKIVVGLTKRRQEEASIYFMSSN